MAATLLVLVAAAGAQPVEEMHAERMAAGLELFRNEVQPLLASTCLGCHGPDQAMGGLDLTSRGSLLASGKIAETAASSDLVAVLRHEREPRMPLGGQQLPAETIDAVARWIDLGAPYAGPITGDPGEGETVSGAEASTFWSFRPLPETGLPQPAGGRSDVAPIDRFILARLEEQGMEQNPSADRRTLIRRASLDLLGLPPDPARVEAFVADPDPAAYERLVDELLESPHYGERWARHWMDIARFAESYGFEEDTDRPFAYHYRDFLIKALNRDMPYERFVQLQVAGDELEPENPLALMATGFLGAGPFSTQITEAEFETVRYDELDDMVGTLGTAMLGLTVGCARCHDHKHDPILSRDYYGMASIFGHTVRSLFEYDPAPEAFRKRRADWATARGELLEARQKIEEGLDGEQFEDWLQEAAELAEPEWQVLEIRSVKTQSGARSHVLDDGSVLFSGDNGDFETYTFETRLRGEPIRALRVEALTHPSMPLSGPGRSRDGHFVLGVVAADVRPLSDPDTEPAKVEFGAARATAQLNDNTGSVMAALITDSQKSGWALNPGDVGADQAATFELKEPVGFEGGSSLQVRLHFGFNAHFSMGRVRLSVSTRPDSPIRSGRVIPQQQAEALGRLRKRGIDALDKTDRSTLLGLYANRDPQWQAATGAVREHDLALPVPTATKIQATTEGRTPVRHNAAGKGYPHFYEQTFVLTRGNAAQKGDPARPTFLPVLMGGDASTDRWTMVPPPGWKRSDFHRAALARWITDVDHGAGALLARVIVNRLWHHHFGSGIVTTPSNFGTMGARPSHPELLEWLARDLVSHGWRLKRLHRMIMTSAAYRASSAGDEARGAMDRGNRLRWRWTPRRLEAEAIRDSLLAVSGLLDPAMYGRGALSEDGRRRSVYFFVKRSELVPSLMLFDWPEHLVGIGARPSTTVAPQALQFLNSPQSRRYASGFAGRLAGSDGIAAVERAYRLALSRPPTPQEASAGAAFLENQEALYEADGRPAAGRLALVDYCQSLLSLNEFLYIR